MVTYILACSIILQLTAAVLALRLIRVTGRRTAWSLIAVALLFMSVRRAIPLYRLLSGDSTIAPDLLNELIGLALSVLMILGVAGIAPLFSAIKRSHEALRESEELYRTVFENTGTATVLIEESTIIAYANAEFESLSKCSKQEIEGKKSWTEFVVKEDLDRMRTQHLLRREKPEAAQKHYDFRFVTNEGDVRNISLSIDIIPGTKRSIASLLDITDGKRAEEALRESERKLREAQEMAHLGYWHLDVETGRVDWSDEVYRIFGLEPKEFTPHIDSILALSPWPEDHQRDKEIIRLAIASHEPGSYEQKFLRPDKSIGHYYSTFQGNYDDQGELVSIVGTVLDITDRKRAEEALRASEEKYRLIADNTLNWILWVDPGGDLRYVSPSCERITGYSPAEFSCHPRLMEEITHPEDKETTDGHFAETQEECVPDELEFRIVTKTGKIRWIDHSCGPIYTQEGVYAGRRATNHDITDRKMADMALRESERKFRETVANLDEGFYSVTMDGVLLDHNQAFNRILGFDETTDLKDKYLPDFWQNPEERGAYLHELADKGSVTNYQISAQTKAGKKITIIASAHLVKDEDDHPLRIEGVFLDITDRKRAEEALHNLLSRQEAILDAVPDIIMEVDNNKIYTWANLAGFEFFGEDVLGKEAAFYFEGAQETYIKVQPLFRGSEDVFHVESWQRRKDGQKRLLAWWCRVLKDGNGNVTGALSSAHDSTDRKRAEEALVASEVRYRRLFESAKDGILILDAETGMIVDVNPFLIEMLGYSHEQFLGKTIWEVGFLSDAVDSKYNFRKLQREKYVRYDDLPLKTSDGRQIEVEFVSNVYDVGETKVIQCNIRDITDRKRAEAGLRESEQKLKATVYGSPIPQFSIDHDHRVVYWNKALEEISGLKAEDMVGTDNYWSAFYKEKRPCMCDLLVDGHADSIPEWYGAQCRRSPLVADAFEVTDFFSDLGDGGKWLLFTAVPIKDSDGHVIGAMETLEDVTGRIRAEMEIHQLNDDLEKRVTDRTAQLQAANKELESFSYSVSHDLRAPLRALDGFSRILIEDYAVQLPDEAVAHLNRVRNGATHMGRLIDDLLRFSRLSRQSLEKQPVSLFALVKETWGALEVEREGRQVELVLGSLPDCQGDPALLKQVFFNLLGNALKYSRRTADARIEIGFLPQVVRAGESPATNVYFVRDNGVGFDMQFAGKLFGVFQRLHRADEYEGTGVGLAIVHRVIARHGGKIWAESEPDKGATFYLTIGDAQVPTIQTVEKAMV